MGTIKETKISEIISDMQYILQNNFSIELVIDEFSITKTPL